MPTDKKDRKPIPIESEKTEAQKAVKVDPELKIHHLGNKNPIRTIEQNIIDTLNTIATLEEEHKKKGYSSEIIRQISGHEKIFIDIISQYTSERFGNSTEAFLNTPIIKKYLSALHLHTNQKLRNKSHLSPDDYTNLRLWILIEHYTLETSSIKKANYLKRIKKSLESINKEIFKPSGQGLFTHINKDCIKNIYLSDDHELINLVMKNPSTKLPIPGIEVFSGGDIPPIIQQRQLDIQAAINKFLEKRASGVETIIAIQRRFRGKRRNKEEHARLQSHPYFSDWNMTPTEIKSEVIEALAMMTIAIIFYIFHKLKPFAEEIQGVSIFNFFESLTVEYMDTLNCLITCLLPITWRRCIKF